MNINKLSSILLAIVIFLSVLAYMPVRISPVQALEIIEIPTGLLVVEEGKSVDFNVTIQNDGTEGTVSVSVTCDIATFTTSETGFNMAAWETRTIKCTAHGLPVGEDTYSKIKVFAQKRGATDTKYIDILVKLASFGGTTVTMVVTPSPSSPSDVFYFWIFVIGAIIVLVVVFTFGTRKKIGPSVEAKVEPPRTEVMPTELKTVVEKEREGVRGAICAACGYVNPPYAVNYCVKCGAKLK